MSAVNKVRVHFFAYFIMVGMFFWSGCTSSPRKRAQTTASPISTEERKQFRSILALKNSDSARALEKAVEFLKTHPNSGLADQAYLLMGDLLLQKADNPRAALAYNKVLNLPERSARLDEARLKLSKIYMQQGEWDRARAILEEGLGDAETTPEYKTNFLKTQLLVFREARQGIPALKTLIKLHDGSSSESERASLRSQSFAIVDALIEGDELIQVAEESSFSFARTAASYKLGKTLIERGDRDRGQRYLRAVEESGPDTDFAAKSRELLLQLEARSRVTPKSIGAILPLSGKNARVGQRALKGIQLALGIFSKGDSDYKLAVIDDESNPVLARRAADRLVAEDHVIGLVGGLQSKTASALASKSQELGVPIITLSQKAGLTQIGDYVFRNAVTGEMQVRQLVESAMQNHNIQNFAVLFPNDAYGTEYANLFWDEVLARGGQIRAAQAYDPKETDFRNVVQRLVGTYYIEDRASEYQAKLKEREKKGQKKSVRDDSPEEILPPIADFEAIFIPDSAKALGQIVPMLAYNDVADILFLGTNLWNTTDTIDRLGKTVPKILFVDSPSMEKVARSSPFIKEFQTVFGSRPEAFEAQAYEAALALRRTIESGETTRESLREALAKSKYLEGVTGKLPLTERREFLRPLIALSIKDAKIVRAE